MHVLAGVVHNKCMEHNNQHHPHTLPRPEQLHDAQAWGLSVLAALSLHQLCDALEPWESCPAGNKPQTEPGPPQAQG